MRARSVVIAFTSMLIVAGLVLGSSVAQAQSDGEWVRGTAQIAESATSGSIERLSVSGSSISVQMAGPQGSNALARYDIKWNEPPTVLKPGEKFLVSASMEASLVVEGVAQFYSEEAFVMRASGTEVLRLLAAQSCGQANGATGPIECSKPVTVPAKGDIVAPMSGQTFVVEALSGRCSCKVTWSYEWQQAAVVAPPPPPPTTTTVPPTTVPPTTAAPAAPAPTAATPAPTTVAPAAPTPSTAAASTATTQPSAAAVPGPSPTQTSQPGVAAAPGSPTAPSTTQPAGGGPPVTSSPVTDSQPGTTQAALPVSSASAEPLITDEEAIAASIAGVFIALIISGLTLAEAGLRLTDLFGESGREVAGSFGAFDADPVSAAATAPPAQASPGTQRSQDSGEAPWYQGGTGASSQAPSEPAPWYEEPAGPGDSGTPGPESSTEDEVVDWLEDAPLPQSEEAAPDPAPERDFEDDVMGLLDDAALGGQAPPLTSRDGLMGGGPAVRITDNDNDGVYDRIEYDTDGDGEFGLDERENLGGGKSVDEVSVDEVSVDEVSVEDASAAPAEDGPVQEQEAAVAENPPAEPEWVSRQEIDDIYQRGLASGRSLDDLREDVAGLSQARGGPAEVPDPYGFQMSATDVGPVPLTPGELADYRAAQQELQRYMGERGRLHREWDEYLSERQEWRGRNQIRSAIEVWNAETRFVEREQLNNEWTAAWRQWLKGNEYYSGPEGSDYQNTYLHIKDPSFTDDPGGYARRELDRLERIARSNFAGRMRYMAEARFRPSAAEEGAKLDDVQQRIIDRNRILSGPINAARERINRAHSYVNGRPLPD